MRTSNNLFGPIDEPLFFMLLSLMIIGFASVFAAEFDAARLAYLRFIQKSWQTITLDWRVYVFISVYSASRFQVNQYSIVSDLWNYDCALIDCFCKRTIGWWKSELD
jgi:cell division protein FtsW (lipid II flippase)